jgi:hypothetical protein
MFKFSIMKLTNINSNNFFILTNFRVFYIVLRNCRLWVGKTGIYIKRGGNGRKGKTLAYFPF